MEGKFIANTKRPKKEVMLLIAKIVLAVFGGIIFLLLLLNAFLSIIIKDYRPKISGHKMYSIVSDSMEPEIKTGAIILCKDPPAQNEIKRGDIITFKVRTTTGSRLVTHRVTAIFEGEEYTYITRGDNTDAPDSEPVYYSSIVGIYSGKKIGGMGYLLSFFSSYYGFVCLLLIVMVIGLMFMLNLFFEKADKTADTKKDVLLKTDIIITEMRQKYGDNPELLSLDYAIALLRTEPSSSEKQDYKKQLEDFAFSESLLLPEPEQKVLQLNPGDIVKLDADQKTIERMFAPPPPKKKAKQKEAKAGFRGRNPYTANPNMPPYGAPPPNPNPQGGAGYTQGGPPPNPNPQGGPPPNPPPNRQR